MSSLTRESKLFDEYYFQHGCGIPYERNEHWLNFFGNIAEAIVRKISPRTALDVGCAMGFLVEGLRERGVEAYGIDVSDYALARVRDDLKPYCQLASILDPFPRRYDLIVCIEVVEHLPAPESARAIENLCKHSDDILFSSTPLDFKEATHFNVQPPEYWAELLAQNDFFHDVDFDASFINPWAARYRRTNEPLPRIVKQYERRVWLLSKENSDVRALSQEMRDRLAKGEERVQALSTQVEEKNNLIDAHAASLAEKDRVIESLGGQIAQSELNVRALNERIAEKERVIESVQAQIAAILNSRSWRIMKPFQRLRSRLFPPKT